MKWNDWLVIAAVALIALVATCAQAQQVEEGQAVMFRQAITCDTREQAQELFDAYEKGGLQLLALAYRKWNAVKNADDEPACGPITMPVVVVKLLGKTELPDGRPFVFVEIEYLDGTRAFSLPAGVKVVPARKKGKDA